MSVQATFLLKFQNKYEDFVSCPGSWLFCRCFKVGDMNTQMGDALFKNIS